jgi:hypothetical protein
MIITPPSLMIGMSRSTRAASLLLEPSGDDNDLIFTAKIPGVGGNRISVKLDVTPDPGVATCDLDGSDITYRIPSERVFEASGPFSYNGSPVDGFGFLWYAGQFNGKKSWSLDGLPITWPLERNGEFLFFADGAWNMIRRNGGSNVMHWKAESDVNDIYQIPRAEYGPGQLDGWQSVAALCSGYIDAHYGVEITQAQYLQLLTDGVPSLFIEGNARVNNLVAISLQDGQSGLGSLVTTPRKRLDEGA